MKRGIFVFWFIFAAGFFSYAEDPIKISLQTPFSLNPILGINGDENEASSKFIQRLIFSPLVFPIEDPYLQDNFNYSLDLSMIDRLDYDTASGWSYFNIYGSNANPPISSKFRVHLRDNLYFREGGETRSIAKLKINAEDIVFSYRLARITSDRVYAEYSKTRENNRRGLELNSLLYSRLRSFVDVYMEKNDKREYDLEHIYFDMEKPLTCVQFIKSLAYVPVLSATQIQSSESIKRTPSSREYESLHKKLPLSDLQNQEAFKNSDYDMYDFKKIRNNKFYESPRGYGQYFVEKGSPSGSSRNPGVFTRCKFVKNDEWCNFGNKMKTVGGTRINHEEYATNTEIIQVDTTQDADPIGRMRNIKPNEVLYNMTLSANMFENGDQLVMMSAVAGKRPMQISHKLYGIYFGPDLQNTGAPLNKNVREFFSYFADRPRLENIIKYIANKVTFTNFDSVIEATGAGGQASFLNDLRLQSLYYPFYMGAATQSTSEDSPLTEIFLGLQKKDSFYKEYLYRLGGSTDLSKYYPALPGDEKFSFFSGFIDGKELPSNVEYELDNWLNSVKTHIVRRNILNIMIYNEKGDHPGKQMANHFRDIVENYFLKNRSNVASSINIQAGEIDKYSDWKSRAETNARNGTISFLVKGWNYKFDMLDELSGTFIEKPDLDEIKHHYEGLIGTQNRINSPNSGSIDLLVLNIVNQFIAKSMMIPLLGLQNYAIYSRQDIGPKSVAFAFETYKDIEILLLPYYWRKK